MSQVRYRSRSEEQTKQLGDQLGRRLRGGEVFVLVSDLGGGKTTWVRGLSEGFGSPDPVSSPSFTIHYVYQRPDKKQLYHFDFYRLEDPGIMASELVEVIGDEEVVTVIEWADVVAKLVPLDAITVHITASSDTNREITIDVPASRDYILAEVEQEAA